MAASVGAVALKFAVFRRRNGEVERDSWRRRGGIFLDPRVSWHPCSRSRGGVARSCFFLGLLPPSSGASHKHRKSRHIATSRVAKEVGAAGGSGGDDDVGDDGLKAAIEKSKKVLAVQKGLLDKIVQRRKLVSSLRDSVVNTQLDDASGSGESDKSPLDFDGPVTTGNDEQNNTIASDIYSKSAPQDTPSISSIGSSAEKEKEALEKSQVGRSLADALGLSKETDSATTVKETDLKATKFRKESEPYGAQDEEIQELLEGNVVDESAQHEDSHEENADSAQLAGVNVMNVILVAAECAPWSKTGGLGDVAGSLPKALAKRGHRVMVVAPRYGNYSEPREIRTRKKYKAGGEDMEVTYFHAYIDGVDFVFIDAPIFRHFENNIYGGERQEILNRMVLFCKAAVEAPWHVPCGGVCYGDGNLVFIANDWHTALLPVYLKAYYRDNGLMRYTRSVLVIHNIAHQGRGPMDDFALTDLPVHYSDLFKCYDPIGGEHFNIFAAGLKTADRIVTVSHGYTWELKTSEGGWGLHEIIKDNDWKLQGIVNGIDIKDWNPKTDVHLQSDGYTNYSLETLETGKAKCKSALQKELGLPVSDNVPVFGFIGRLDQQKGVDLIAEAIPWMVNQDIQLIMLGTGRKDLEDMLRKFESQYHEKIRGWVGFSVKTAHRITAGADILLMPSRFEPCGLNQLYAMKYGTVPVVHAVGGLRDTVKQFDPFNESGVGWTFDRAETSKLIDAMGHCLHTYWNYKNSWKGLQRRGMMQDLSWDNAAQHYEEVLVKAKYQW